MCKILGCQSLGFKIIQKGMVAHTCDPQPWEVEVGASGGQGQFRLYSQFQDTLDTWSLTSKRKNSMKDDFREKLIYVTYLWQAFSFHSPCKFRLSQNFLDSNYRCLLRQRMISGIFSKFPLKSVMLKPFLSATIFYSQAGY